jgi:two-component system, response regulator
MGTEVPASDRSVDILLVEDNPEDHALTLIALLRHELPNRIHVVRDGQEALDYVFCLGAYADRQMTDQPRVILLDLNLRLIDGLEVLRRLKGDPETQTIPVVMLTSSDETRDLIECYRLGVNSYIVKPVAFDQFKKAVQVIATYWLQLNRPPKAA